MARREIRIWFLADNPDEAEGDLVQEIEASLRDSRQVTSYGVELNPPDVCPFDCDSCHGSDCPCDRMGCEGSGVTFDD